MVVSSTHHCNFEPHGFLLSQGHGYLSSLNNGHANTSMPTTLTENCTCGISAGFRTVCPVGTCLSLDECFAMSASGSSSFSLAFEVSSTQTVLWLVSDDASSCNRLINSVINPFHLRERIFASPSTKLQDCRNARGEMRERGRMFFLGETPYHCHHFGSCEVCRRL